MYDTIKIYLDRITSIDFDELTNLKEQINQATGEIKVYGMLRNLKVSINGDSVFFEGSLSKFYYGNNIEQLTINDTKRAFELISELLKIPFEQIELACLFRLDIAFNLLLNESPNNYLDCFGDLSRYKKVTYERSGLYYNQSNKKLLFYDKLKEMNNKREFIPNNYLDENILRIELRFMKRLYTAFKQKKILVKDLYSESFYNKAVNILDNLFNKIERKQVNKLSNEILNNINAKNFTNYLANEQLKVLGIENTIKLIEQAQNNKNIDSVQAHRIKKKIKEISCLPNFTEQSLLIKEIDTKFKKHLSKLN